MQQDPSTFQLNVVLHKWPDKSTTSYAMDVMLDFESDIENL